MKKPGELIVTTPTDLEIVVTREFAASRQALFDAMMRPDLLKKWLLGPPGWKMSRCEVPNEVGEAYCHEWQGPKGECLKMEGIFRQIDPPERVVRTETCKVGDQQAGAERQVTLLLTERPGHTLLTLTMTFPEKSGRDEMLHSGFDQGLMASFERLESLLAGPSAGAGAPAGVS